VDGREITGFSPEAPSGVGDGGCLWTGIGTGPWHCLARGVNRILAAAQFWERWIWQEAKDVGGGGLGLWLPWLGQELWEEEDQCLVVTWRAGEHGLEDLEKF